MSDTNRKIIFHPNRILVTLLIITLALVILSILGQYLRYFQHFVDIRPWMEFSLDILNHKFYLDAETNVPTWFNSVLLLGASTLFFTIAAIKKIEDGKYTRHWMGLGIIWFFFSIDELAVLHETLIKPMRGMFGADNWFFFAWVIPGLFILFILGLAYVNFFLYLNTRFKILFLLSMLIYFGGAVGGEMVSGHFAQTIGQRNFNYAVIASIEESVELIGASLTIFSLLKYIEENIQEVRIATGKN